MITLLYILHRHGGIAISENLLLTEQLDWVEGVRKSPFLNGDFTSLPVEVVGFFAPEASSDPGVANWGRGEWHRAVSSLALQSYFLGAVKGAYFLQELIKRILQLLQSQEALAAATKELAKNPELTLFGLLFQKVSKEMLKEKGVNGPAEFGVAAINELFAPAKLDRLMNGAEFSQRMTLLSHLPLEDLEAAYGQFRYFTLLRHEEEMLYYLGVAAQSSSALMKDSFIHLFLLPQDSNAYANPEVESASDELWASLPKVVWVYAPEGVENSGIVTVLLAARIRQAALDAGLEFREANNSNLHDFIEDGVIERIDAALEHPFGQGSPKSKSELVRLALLEAHGGVFMEEGTVLVEGLEWLQRIASISSGRVFNRCSALPSCFLFWDPLASHPSAWKVTPQCNSKAPQNPRFLNGFIAAEKGSPLISEWLDLHLSLLAESKESLRERVDGCGSSEYGPEALAVNALSCVMADRRKAAQAEEEMDGVSPAQFYRLWSMSSLGFGKAGPPGLVESDLLFEITQLPVSYLEEVGGPLEYLVRLSGLQMEELADYIIQHHENLHEYVHGDSFVGRFLLSAAPFGLAYEGQLLKVRSA